MSAPPGYDLRRTMIKSSGACKRICSVISLKDTFMQLAVRPALARFVMIDRILREETDRLPNATELARRLEVNARTVRRDIEWMRDRLNAPISFDRSKNGYLYTEPSYRLPFLQLTEGELVALFLGEQLLRQYRGTPYATDIARAYEKISTALSDQIHVDLQLLSEAISFRTAAPAQFDLAVIPQILTGIMNRKRLKITYDSASSNAVGEREIDPYHLMTLEGQYYLFAYCHTRQEIRQFVPGRIREIYQTGTTFERDPSFQVTDFLAASLSVIRGDDAGARHAVTLKFTGPAVRYAAERQWHPHQRLEHTPDGALLMMFTVSHLLEAQRLVQTWVPHCEALEPPELRTAVAQALKQGAKGHLPTVSRREAKT